MFVPLVTVCKIVLIETYWNVKEEVTQNSYFEVIGINRNILECKVQHYLFRIYLIVVLIETYWNVK